MTTQWTRRQFLRRALIGGLGLSSVFLAACGGKSSATTTASTTSAAAASSTGAINVATPDHSSMPGMTMTAGGTSAATPESQAPAPATPSGNSTPDASPVNQGGATQAPVAVTIVEPSLDYQTWTYKPNDLQVPVGTTVVWTNDGGAAHTVTTDDGTSFDSGPIQPGKQFSRVMNTAGTFPYHCTFHPFMKGTVTVTG